MMEACLNTIVTLSRKCQEANIIVSLNNINNIILRNHIVIYCYIQFTCSMCLVYLAGNWRTARHFFPTKR